MDDILIKTKSGGFKTVNAVVPSPLKEEDLIKILQPKAPAAPIKAAVIPSWRDKIVAPVIKPKAETAPSLSPYEGERRREVSNQENQKFNTSPQPSPSKGEGGELVPSIPPTKKVSAPAFYFDVKDEEEAKEFKDDKMAIAREKKEQSINLGAAKIARQIKDTVPEINIASPEDLVRLSKIVASRLRDIRSLVDTKDSLMKKNESGGLSVVPEAADKIIKIIEKEKIKWQEKPEEYIKLEVGSWESGVGSRESGVGSWKPETTYDRQPTTEKIPKWKEELEAGSDDINNPQLQKIVAAIKARDKRYELGDKNITDERRQMTNNQQPATNYQQPTTNNREDFNYQSYLMKEKRERRVMGPVEELLNMDLKEFRILGRSPKESVNKLYEKIVNLAQVSLEERAKGIAAWKSSPLYQLYVSVGEESLIKSLPIEGVLRNIQNGLTWDEFQAIGDLNEQLNY